MSHRSRRAAAALTSAVALTAGLIGAFGAGTAQAATSAANGVIAYQATDGSVHFINADGTGDHAFAALPATGSGSLSWDADGSRIALSGNGSVATVKYDGSAPLTVASHNVTTSDGVYGAWSGWILSDNGHALYQQTSDGWSNSAAVLPAADEPSTVNDSQPTANQNGVIAFTRNWGNLTSIMTYNTATRVLNEVAKNASNPRFSSDGSTIVYEQGQGSAAQIGAVNVDGSNQRTLTSDAAGAHRPSLSPDGTGLAYTSFDSTSGSNVVKLLNLSTNTTTVLAKGQAAVWQPLRKAFVNHVYGINGVSNDAAASRWQFNTLGHYTPGLLWAKNAVLANKYDTTGASLGIALAAEKQGPLLLTSGGSLDSAASADLKRTLTRGSTVYLEGDTSQISNTVVSQVQRLGFRVVRVAAAGGASGESVANAWNIAHAPNWVFVADSMDYRVAASAASMAASAGNGGRSVVLLNTGWSLPSTLKAFFNRSNPGSTNVVVIGNHSIYAMEHTPLNQAWRFWTLGGTDAEYLSYNMARFWWGSPNVTTLANSSDWRSGFAGASVNAGYGPLLWTSATGLDPVDKLYLQQESAGSSDVQIFGYGWPTATVNGIEGAIGATPAWATLMQDPNGTVPSGATAHTAGVTGGLAAHSPAAAAPHGAGAGAALHTSSAG